MSTHYTPARGALDALLRRGLVRCWSTAKPVYVRAEDAPAVREHLREELLAAICVQGQATPSRLKSVPLAGLVLGVDLLSELARELLAEGRIVTLSWTVCGSTRGLMISKRANSAACLRRPRCTVSRCGWWRRGPLMGTSW